MSRTVRKYIKILVYACVVSFTFLVALLGFNDRHAAQGRVKDGLLVNLFAQSTFADAPGGSGGGSGTGIGGDDDDDDDNDDGAGDDSGDDAGDDDAGDDDG